MPDALVLLFGITILMMILTWIIPAGQFERIDVSGRTMIVPDSFEFIANNPQSPFDLLLSMPQAFSDASGIIFFLLITGGAFNLINATGTIEAIIGRIVSLLNGREEWMIPILVFVFGIAGGTIGLSEEVILFIPIGIALARALGYDALTGVATMIMGATIGFSSGLLNPFTTGVAQGVAELPLFSGLWLRIILFAFFYIVTVWWIVRYARRIKAQPETSLVYDVELEDRASGINIALEQDGIQQLNRRHIIILLVDIIGFAFIIHGVFNLGWFLDEIAATFFAMGILSGIIGGMSFDEIVSSFVSGSGEMVYSVMAILLARTILVVMENGLILDTIINSLTSVIGKLPSVLAAVGMYVIQLIINVVIPSGSGQAAATMPLMVPLADSLDVNRQVTVLAFILGDGFMDSIIPTSGVLMAQLALAKISYERWVRFLAPLMGIFFVFGIVLLIFAHNIGYGPF